MHALPITLDEAAHEIVFDIGSGTLQKEFLPNVVNTFPNKDYNYAIRSKMLSTVR